MNDTMNETAAGKYGEPCRSERHRDGDFVRYVLFSGNGLELFRIICMATDAMRVRWLDHAIECVNGCDAAGVKRPGELAPYHRSVQALRAQNKVIESHGKSCPHCEAIRVHDAELARLREKGGNW